MNTTLNIRNDILEQITKVAQSNGVSRSEMIVLLFQKVAGDITDPGRLGKMIKYQNRSAPEDWHVFHVRLREDVYEYWLDLRKLLKMSVSLILAYAVKKYRGKKLRIKSADNYPFKNYIIIKEILDNIIVWKFIWGWPYHLKRLIKYKNGRF
jgi:hypothetical protein